MFSGLLLLLFWGGELSGQPGLRGSVSAWQHVSGHHSLHVPESVRLQLELVNARPGFVVKIWNLPVGCLGLRARGREGIQLGWPSGIMQWAELLEKEADTFAFMLKAQRARLSGSGTTAGGNLLSAGPAAAWTWVDLKPGRWFTQTDLSGFPISQQGRGTKDS